MTERRTPLYDIHLHTASKLVKGGGDYMYPLSYTSPVEEHLNTRTNVGMQDLSTMGKILYWHDIPIQAKAEDENGRAGVQLSARFREAIDEAAMAANLIGDNDYTNGLQWLETEAREGSAMEVEEAVASELELQFAEIHWRSTVRKLKQDR
jgi:hypothetical protein